MILSVYIFLSLHILHLFIHSSTSVELTGHHASHLKHFCVDFLVQWITTDKFFIIFLAGVAGRTTTSPLQSTLFSTVNLCLTTLNAFLHMSNYCAYILYWREYSSIWDVYSYPHLTCLSIKYQFQLGVGMYLLIFPHISHFQKEKKAITRKHPHARLYYCP